MEVKDHYVFHRKIDAYFCQSFGPQINGPGISNEFLAKLIIKKYRKDPLPLIIQKDCADAFPEDIYIDKIISEHQTPGKYLDSYEVSRQCFEFCLQNNIKTVLVFAHPDHVWRVAKTIKKFGLDWVIADTKGTPYDPKSVQLWTRSKWLFIPREIIVILAYWFSHKI